MAPNCLLLISTPDLKGLLVLAIFSEVKLRKLEQIIVERFKDKIKHWIRYINEAFAAIQKENDENKFLDELNLIGSNIKFMVEIDKSNTFSDLDIKITETKEYILEAVVCRKSVSIN